MKYALALGAAIALGAGAYAYAQVYSGPAPHPIAAVCAYNTVIPTPVNGQFFYVQCDSTGRLVVQ